MYEDPMNDPMMIDWTRDFPNGTSIHFAEPRHSTIAITEDAQLVMTNHRNKGKNAKNGTPNKDPLFLYIAYTAGHSPLQPLPEHLEACRYA